MNAPETKTDEHFDSQIPIADKSESFIEKNQLGTKNITQKQLAEALRQAIMSGDFVHHVYADKTSVTYMPWLEVESIRALYHELIYAVTSKHEGESRHETALRYIREREEKTEASNNKTSCNS